MPVIFGLEIAMPTSRPLTLSTGNAGIRLTAYLADGSIKECSLAIEETDTHMNSKGTNNCHRHAASTKTGEAWI